VAILVPSESEESHAPVCFGYASQPLALLAMTNKQPPSDS